MLQNIGTAAQNAVMGLTTMTLCWTMASYWCLKAYNTWHAVTLSGKATERPCCLIGGSIWLHFGPGNIGSTSSSPITSSQVILKQASCQTNRQLLQTFNKNIYIYISPETVSKSARFQMPQSHSYIVEKTMHVTGHRGWAMCGSYK